MCSAGQYSNAMVCVAPMEVAYHPNSHSTTLRIKRIKINIVVILAKILGMNPSFDTCLSSAGVGVNNHLQIS